MSRKQRPAPPRKRTNQARLLTARVAAAQCVTGVLQGRSLEALIQETSPLCDGPPLMREISMGTVRHVYSLSEELHEYLHKPLDANTEDVEAILLTALYQLRHTRQAVHAVVNDAVAAARKLRKGWASGLCNAVLRKASRVKSYDPVSESARFEHPAWMVEQIKQAWPQDWEQILHTNNSRAPMTLRLPAGQPASALKALLEASDKQLSPGMILPDAWTVTPPMSEKALLALLGDGDEPAACAGESASAGEQEQTHVSRFVIQDEGAQLCASLLDAGQAPCRILDACAAPGGKSSHLLDLYPQATLHMLEVDEERFAVLKERVQAKISGTHSHKLMQGDLCAPTPWWDGHSYERILLDAPCSSTGAIRRHPDIKLLRRDTDIAALAEQQLKLLKAAWNLLAPGGLLLYCTCSVLPRENVSVVEAFMESADNVVNEPIEATWGKELPLGRALLPTTGGHDGFFFSRLRKHVGKVE